jgi:hypothetical protein
LAFSQLHTQFLNGAVQKQIGHNLQTSDFQICPPKCLTSPKADDMKEFHSIADRNAERIEALRQLLESTGPNKLLKSPSNEIVDTKKLALRHVARCEKLSKKVASIKPAQVLMLDLRTKYGSHGRTQAQSMGTRSLRSLN